jgi:hypothetical protein
VTETVVLVVVMAVSVGLGLWFGLRSRGPTVRESTPASTPGQRRRLALFTLASLLIAVVLTALIAAGHVVVGLVVLVVVAVCGGVLIPFAHLWGARRR